MKRENLREVHFLKEPEMNMTRREFTKTVASLACAPFLLGKEVVAQDKFQFSEELSRQNENMIATLIHISDVHFGNKFTTVETLFKKLLATYLPGYNGLRPHSYRVVEALVIRVNHILDNRKEKGIPVGVVFTGDLTIGGEAKEFGIGNTFLRGAHWVGTQQSIGLNLKEDREVIDLKSTPALFYVPGNHDIWSRRSFLGKKRSEYYNYFPGAFAKQWQLKTLGRSIFLYGLDSTQTSLPKSVLARGRIEEKQLNDLCDKLKFTRLSTEEKEAIKIVFLHHPLADPNDKSFDLTMRLDDREVIARRLKENGADLVLAGHVHEEFHILKDSGMPHHAIAGTATQMFSDCSFSVLDIYNRKICLQVWECPYSYKGEMQFLLNDNKASTFSLAHPEPTPVIEDLGNKLKIGDTVIPKAQP